MRLPHRVAVRVPGAIVVVGLLIIFTGSASIGSHHLENEGGAEAAQKAPAKIIVIQPAGHVMLVEGKRSLWASICDADGENCKDAKKAKWSVKPRKGLKLGPKKGAQSIAEGARPGLYTVTAKQNGIVGTTTVKINEPPDRRGAKASGDELRLVVEPEGFVVGVGGEARFVTWGCPAENGTGTGANGVADGLDDACTTVPIEAVRPPSRRVRSASTSVVSSTRFPSLCSATTRMCFSYGKGLSTEILVTGGSPCRSSSNSPSAAKGSPVTKRLAETQASVSSRSAKR